MDAMTRPGQNGDATDTETLMLMSGVALVVFGAGLILSNRSIRGYVGRALGQGGAGGLLQAAVPDVERYLKLRAM
jgi:hypothetical protein